MAAEGDLERTKELAQYDLTQKMAPFLDRHLMFPIATFLSEKGVFNEEDITKVELELLSQTNMVDFTLEKYAALGVEPSEELKQKRDKVLRQLEETQALVMPLLEKLESEEEVKALKEFKSIAEICERWSIRADTIEGLVTYARLQYDCGSYGLSGDLLKHYQNLVGKEKTEVMSQAQVGASWGMLASLILNTDWDGAAEVILNIDDYLDKRAMQMAVDKREVLLHRTWLLHWTLFVIFKDDRTDAKDKAKLLDFFLHDKNMSIISLSCPYLFRYVSACLILQRRLKHLLQHHGLVWIMYHEAHAYQDPITRFLLALYTETDFDEAQRELQMGKRVCEGDYLLAQHAEDFEENARLLIFETYCRIHSCINIEMIASKLNMGAEEAELWIVKLIQNAKLDARIDSEKKRVVMSKAPPSVYQQVIDKTKNLSFRSTMLISNLDKRDEEKAKEKR